MCFQNSPPHTSISSMLIHICTQETAKSKKDSKWHFVNSYTRQFYGNDNYNPPMIITTMKANPTRGWTQVTLRSSPRCDWRSFRVISYVHHHSPPSTTDYHHLPDIIIKSTILAKMPEQQLSHVADNYDGNNDDDRAEKFTLHFNLILICNAELTFLSLTHTIHNAQCTCSAKETS